MDSLYFLIASHLGVGAAGVIFSARVTNWIRGIPSEVAAVGEAAKAKVVADVSSATAKVLSDAKASLLPAPAAPAAAVQAASSAPAMPAAPVAQAAPKAA